MKYFLLSAVSILILSMTVSDVHGVPSPHKQLSNGVQISDVICNDSMALIFKASDGSPACVNPESVNVLILIGWASHAKETNIILYVSPDIQDCMGVILQKCMLVKETKDAEWEFLYDKIMGFEHVLGTEYTLKVKLIHIENPPQDASSIEYTLVEILNSTKSNSTGMKTVMTITNLPATLGVFSQTHPKYVDVFGVHIVATPDTSDAKILHAANIMIQYLDNDENGVPDNPDVVDAMTSAGSVLMMASDFTGNELAGIFENDELNSYCLQDLYGIETNPATGFDASLEEVFHLITDCGYSVAYPDIFSTESTSKLTEYMDKARGGYFETTPTRYPAEAWYTYDDPTCDHDCQASEYIYWAMTSILGAQEDRFDQIKHEWKLNTAEKVLEADPDVYALLINPIYKLPTVLPDGTYR